MHTHIRKLTENDADAFFELRLESLRNSVTSYLSTYEEERELGKGHYITHVLSLKDNDNVIFGAFLGMELVGIAGIYPATRSKISHRALIWGMYVKPEYRRDGIGRSLMVEALLHTKNKIKCLAIELSVESKNIPAKALYESFAFKAWGTEPMAFHVDDLFCDEIHMKLIIEK